MKNTETLVCLRVYLSRRRTKRASGFWGRLFGRPLSYHLATQALRSGVAYATVTLGHAGFTREATRVEVDQFEIPSARLPVCVELIGSHDSIESFIQANQDDLADALLLRMEGENISLRQPTP